LSAQPDGLIGKRARLRFNRKGLAVGFLGQDIFNTTAAGQSFTNMVRRGARAGKKNFIAIQNVGTAPDAFLIQGDSSAGGYTIRYYLGNSTDIEVTDLVTGGGFEAGRLAPSAATGDATFLRVDLFADTTVPVGETNSFLITISSVNDPSKQDAVQTTVITR
jgi:hypothetical protein